MWFEKRGLVTSVRENHCIVLTPDGGYEKIPLPSQAVTVGEEVTFSRIRIPVQIRPVLMAASFLLVFMSSMLLYQANLNQVAAYVALDINPSLEISVDRNLKVIDVLCLDEDASKLAAPGEFKGKSLNDTISELIDKAVEQDYIKSGEENLIVSTISNVEADAETVDQEAICELLEKSVASKGRKVQVKVYTTSDEIHQKARNKGISSGKYLIYNELKKNGKPVKIDDLKKDSVKNVMEEHQVELPPNYKKFTTDKDKRGKSNDGKDNDGKKAPGKYKDMSNNASKASGKGNNNTVPGKAKDEIKGENNKDRNNDRDKNDRDSDSRNNGDRDKVYRDYGDRKSNNRDIIDRDKDNRDKSSRGIQLNNDLRNQRIEKANTKPQKGFQEYQGFKERYNPIQWLDKARQQKGG